MKNKKALAYTILTFAGFPIWIALIVIGINLPGTVGTIIFIASLAPFAIAILSFILWAIEIDRLFKAVYNFYDRKSHHVGNSN